MKKINIVWFKRDLRLDDHSPLLRACQEGIPIVAIALFEPLIENYADFDRRHWQFCFESLKEINQNICINILYQEAIQTFEYLIENYDIQNVFSYQETGLSHTYERDIEISKLLKKHKINWYEDQTNAVIRAAKNLKGWDAAWIDSMRSPLSDSKKSSLENKSLFLKLDQDDFSILSEMLCPYPKNFVTPGESQAYIELDNFLNKKLDLYFSSISYPEKSRYYCSKLSAYISWGNISLKQIYQKCMEHKKKSHNKKSLNQFMTRLKWHCHFVQKLERNLDYESHNLNPAFNNIRHKKNKKYIKAWKNAQTGIPIIDACMRALIETGYLNFRMRAMLVSFLTHHLWQPWQEGSYFLARQFLDYEPGIHYPQFQMQAASTGVHTIRIYNPIKQAKSFDKEATFIKSWLPALKDLPAHLAICPWEMTPLEEQMYDFKLGLDYPKPIVDVEKAAANAREKLWEVKNSKKSAKHSKKIINQIRRS